MLLYNGFLHERSEFCYFIISVIVKILTNSEIPDFQVMDFEKNGHGKSWKSHGILNGRRCTNPDLNAFSAALWGRLYKNVVSANCS